MKAAVLTVSDRVSRGEATDLSGPAAAELLRGLGFEVTDVHVVADGVGPVSAALKTLVTEANLVVTSGGTGFSQRDLTPEATSRVIERPAPGLAEAMRAATFGKNPHGMLSRGVAGIVGTSLIVNLPGSVKAVEEGLNALFPGLRHSFSMIRGGKHS